MDKTEQDMNSEGGKQMIDENQKEILDNFYNINLKDDKVKNLIGSLGLWELRILYYFWMGNYNKSPQAILDYYNITTDSRTSVRRGLEALESKGLLRKDTSLIPENNEKYSVYVHTFPNGKRYVGRSKNPLTRWNNGRGYMTNEAMYKDIEKYGWDNIEHSIIAENLTLEEANRLERNIIDYYNLVEEGYNRR